MLPLQPTPWAGWDEWNHVYACLFALDDAPKRALGVKHVESWRLRGGLPLSVDATASIVEIGLLDKQTAGHEASAPSKHACTLMYAMAVTRLVNGITDPLQQAARASSVKHLAQSVGLPPSLVELRHDCTHNRLPSLDRLRVAADQALLWLHEHYWLPQRAAQSESKDAMRRCLTEYQSATFARSSEHEAPLRKHVLDCSVALDQCLRPAQLATDLIPALFDEGFLVPSTMDPAPAADVIDEVEPPSTAAVWDWEAARNQWSPLFVRLARLWPKHGVHSALLVAAVQRLHDESALTTSTAGATSSLTTRLHALQGWAMHLLEQSSGIAVSDGSAKGVDAKSSCGLEAAALHQVAWLCVRAPFGWGTPIVARAMKHPGWSQGADGEAPADATFDRLLRLQDAAERIRSGSYEHDLCAVSASAVSTSELKGLASSCAPRVTDGSAWRVCPMWRPTAIGAPPSEGSLRAVLPLVADAATMDDPDTAAAAACSDDPIDDASVGKQAVARRHEEIITDTERSGGTAGAPSPAFKLLFRRDAAINGPEDATPPKASQGDDGLRETAVESGSLPGARRAKKRRKKSE